MGYVESSFASQAEAPDLLGLRVQQSLASLSLQVRGSYEGSGFTETCEDVTKAGSSPGYESSREP